MATQAQARQRAKERVRQVKRALKQVDTRLEVLERRQDKLLERKQLITIEAWDSYLDNWDKMVEALREYERTLIAVMIVFRLNG